MLPVFTSTWSFIKDVKIELDWEHKKPIWNGICEKGKTILINGEAGIGDELFGAKFSFNFVKKELTWISLLILATPKKINRIVHIKIFIHVDKNNFI